MLPLLLGVSAPAHAAEALRIDAHGDWAVFRDGVGAERLCWAATKATRRQGADDGERFLIMYTAHGDEFTVVLEGSETRLTDGHLSLGGQWFALFFEDGWGWLVNTGDAPTVRRLLETETSAEILVRGAGYVLSLDGFAKALAAAERACP